MRRKAMVLLMIYVVFVGVFLPIILYYYIGNRRIVNINIKREWNTERAHKALQIVESSFLNDTFGGLNVTFVCNNTLEKYIMQARNGDTSKTYSIDYLAVSTEGTVSMYLKRLNDTEYSIIIGINNEILVRMNTTVNISSFYSPVFLYINGSILNTSLEEINITFTGITVHSEFMYFEACRYHLLCGDGFHIEQTVVFSDDLHMVLVFVTVAIVVS